MLLQIISLLPLQVAGCPASSVAAAGTAFYPLDSSTMGRLLNVREPIAALREA